MLENKEIMARNIKYFMDKKGVNATEVCNTLGFKSNTFSDWVTAKSYPRIDKIEKLANYFGVSKAFLVEDIVPVTHFTQSEVNIICDYRNADDETQAMVRRILKYSKIEGEGGSQ